MLEICLAWRLFWRLCTACMFSIIIIIRVVVMLDMFFCLDILLEMLLLIGAYVGDLILLGYYFGDCFFLVGDSFGYCFLLEDHF